MKQYFQLLWVMNSMLNLTPPLELWQQGDWH
jgi:hypothetical protein